MYFVAKLSPAWDADLYKKTLLRRCMSTVSFVYSLQKNQSVMHLQSLCIGVHCAFLQGGREISSENYDSLLICCLIIVDQNGLSAIDF